MTSSQKPSGANFEHDLDGSFSSKEAPRFYRTDWEGVELPRRPSLKLTDDEFFFELLACNNRDETEKKRNSFFDFVPRAANVSDSKESPALAEQECEVSAKNHIHVPLHIRKTEIELVQRKLPRYPSYTHLSEPNFYPLKKHNSFFDSVPIDENMSHSKETHTLTEQECELSAKEQIAVPLHIRTIEIEAVQRKLPRYPSYTHLSEPSFYPLASCGLPESQEREIEASSVQTDEDYTTTEIESECSENEEEILLESYYSDYTSAEDEENEIELDEIFPDDIDKEMLNKMKMMHSQNIEYIDQQLVDSSLRTDEDIQCSIKNIIGEPTRSCVYELSCSSIAFPPQLNSSLTADENVQGSIYNTIGEPSKTYVHESSCSSITFPPLLNSSLTADENVQGSINNTIGEPSKTYAHESSCSSIAFSPQFIAEDEPYELKIGVVSLAVRAMIIQARMELRCRKVSKEHKRKFKPVLAQAPVVGRATRLDEYIVEACGKKHIKYDPSVIPSAVWVKGEETVSLPTFHDPTRLQFKIFKEACALGSIMALKPKITTSYDRFLPTKSSHDDEVDVDDTTRHKRIRIKYLTDIYLHQDHKDRSIDEDDDLEFVHYESLNDVELPTIQCPVHTCVTAKITQSEVRETTAQQVAESVWERRYRLERPRAEQRIRDSCYCKYCKTPSTYQTLAYRKKWLIQQNLWKGQPVDDTIKETDLKPTKERPVNDTIKETDLKLTKEQPVNDTIKETDLKPTKERPVNDTIKETDLKPTKERPVNDTIKETNLKPTKERPVNDTIKETDLKPTKERPVNDTIKETDLKPTKERPVNDTIKETDLKPTKERPVNDTISTKRVPVDDTIKETDIKPTSNRTVVTRKMSNDDFSHFEEQTSSDTEEVEISSFVSLGSSSDTPRSQSFASEEFEFTENDKSAILEADEDRFDSEKSSVDMDGGSSPPKTSIMIPADEDRFDSEKPSVDIDGGVSSPPKISIIIPADEDRFDSEKPSVDMDGVSSPPKTSIIISVDKVRFDSEMASVDMDGVSSPHKTSITIPVDKDRFDSKMPTVDMNGVSSRPKISIIIPADKDRFDSSKSSVDMDGVSSPPKTSIIIPADKDRFDSSKLSVDMDGVSNQLKTSITISARPTSAEKKEQIVNRKNKKSFMREVQSLLGLTRHSRRSLTRIEDSQRQRLERSKRMPNKSKRLIRNGAKSVRSLFSNSSHVTETSHSWGNF